MFERKPQLSLLSPSSVLLSPKKVGVERSQFRNNCKIFKIRVSISIHKLCHQCGILQAHLGHSYSRYYIYKFKIHSD